MSKMQIVFTALALLVLLIPATVAQAESPEASLSQVAANLDVLLTALDRGDAEGARAAFQSFDDGWSGIEDSVKARSRAAYRDIEDAMGDLKYALKASQTDLEAARSATRKLQEVCTDFSAGTYGAQPVPQSMQGTRDVATLVGHLDTALRALAAGDVPSAAGAVREFRGDWPDVEGLVKVNSPRIYTSAENGAAEAAALLAATPPETQKAVGVIQQMRDDLFPLSQGETRYGFIDAAIILLREGLEALLVVAALLAFLRKTGAANKGRWIWGGSFTGLLASLAVAVVVNLVFSTASAGANRELLEGLTGLVAAAMLVYVSYWLHSKSRLGAWQKYIHDKSTTALARNSLMSLAFIAFLAVFREGAETVLFYVGIAPSIAPAELAFGLAVGFGGLVVIGVLLLVFGLSLPIRPFFLVTSTLIYYLAFKFVGTGLHALQIAGVLRATPSPHLPEVSFLGLYPTWETTVVQLLLLLAAVGAIAGLRLRERQHTRQAHSPAGA